MDHAHFMDQALQLARTALKHDEFPVGCVLVHEEQVIVQAARRGTAQQIPSELEHAEMLALRRLEQTADSVPRGQVTLYVTLEPCLMCFGALLLSGIGTIVYAYEDAMGGGTACDRTRLPELYRQNGVQVIAGVRRQESLALFKTFFTMPHIHYWQGSYLARYTLEQPEY